ncbi:MAG: LPS export ABC transporter permease LptF [Deltaproteobacteria bacterium]|nr:MAG: LPS export ABC transporter permease LptF [Deltaproteobacteria bacterium]
MPYTSHLAPTRPQVCNVTVKSFTNSWAFITLKSMRKTLLRYLVVEQVVPFFVSLFVLTVVLFLGKSMRYTQLLLGSGSGLTDLGKLLVYSLPYFLAFTIPMATLLAVLVSFARLAHDSEITAMKAAGISFYGMIPPVALLAGSAWLITLCLSLFVFPNANIALDRVLLEMAQSRAHLAFKERVFNNQFGGLVFFINRISSDGKRFQEVFISDERSPETRNTIVAEEGLLVTEPDGRRIILRLFRGSIMRLGDDMQSVQTIRFQNYDFSVDLQSVAFGGSRFHKDKQHFSMRELREALASTEPGSERHNILSLEWHRRFSLPFACIVLGFIAAPLSVQSGSQSRLSGVVIGLVLFLVYYILLSAAQALGEDGTYPPAIGLWLPNVVFGILAVVLWIKTARESTFKPFALARHLVGLVTSKFKSRHRCELP